MGKITVRRYQVELPAKMAKPISPVKAVMIGDLHNKVFGENNQDLVDKIRNEQPDLIFSVGDLTVVKPGREVKPEVGLQLLAQLSTDVPVYASWGNHEYRTKIYPDTYPDMYERMKKEIAQTKVHLLEDEKDSIEVKGTRFTIYGYELPMEYYAKFCRKKLPAEEIAEKLGNPIEDTYNILLAHNPHFFEGYAGWGADITFSGHAHGGIIRLPFIGGVISPQAKLFPRQVCGLYDKDGKKLCVTAGLGTHSFIPRINNPAEITAVTFI